MKRKLHTRKEIITIWQMPIHKKYLNYYCCPDCRDILTQSIDGKHLYCASRTCTNKSIYTLEGEEIV